MIHLPNTVDVRRLDIVNGNLYSTYRSPLTPIAGHHEHQPVQRPAFGT